MSAMCAHLCRGPHAACLTPVRVQFPPATLEKVLRGEVTLAFRRWIRPTVKAGDELRTILGVVYVETVTRVDEGDIGEEEARRAGSPSRAELSRDPRGAAGLGVPDRGLCGEGRAGAAFDRCGRKPRVRMAEQLVPMGIRLPDREAKWGRRKKGEPA